MTVTPSIDPARLIEEQLSQASSDLLRELPWLFINTLMRAEGDADRLAQSLGVTGLSKSQVSEMAKDLDEHVEQFRTRRPNDAGPFTFVTADALVLKVREGGRGVGVHALVARGLIGVRLVTSDAPIGLVAAIGSSLQGAAWQRCRTHYAANLISITPRASWPWVKTMVRSIYDQPDAVHAQFDRVIDALQTKLPDVADQLESVRANTLAFPKEIW